MNQADRPQFTRIEIPLGDRIARVVRNGGSGSFRHGDLAGCYEFTGPRVRIASADGACWITLSSALSLERMRVGVAFDTSQGRGHLRTSRKGPSRAARQVEVQFDSVDLVARFRGWRDWLVSDADGGPVVAIFRGSSTTVRADVDVPVVLLCMALRLARVPIATSASLIANL